MAHTPCVIVGTDAEKAFDCKKWRFLSAVLRHLGLGDHMLNWITKIYSHPTAQVKANGILSDPFPITNWNRQGCHLSPLLCTRSLEPFLYTVCLNSDMIGVRDKQHKISAYADDLLFSPHKPVGVPSQPTPLILWPAVTLEDQFWQVGAYESESFPCSTSDPEAELQV